MGIDDIVLLGRDAMLVTLLASAPMLLSGMIVGLGISIFQSVTQIQEMTLTFIPKVVCMLLALLLALPWLMERMISFTRDVFINIPVYIR